jgi:hypothetical protein
MTKKKLSWFDFVPVSCNGLGECSYQPPNTIHLNKKDVEYHNYKHHSATNREIPNNQQDFICGLILASS